SLSLRTSLIGAVKLAESDDWAVAGGWRRGKTVTAMPPPKNAQLPRNTMRIARFIRSHSQTKTGENVGTENRNRPKSIWVGQTFLSAIRLGRQECLPYRYRHLNSSRRGKQACLPTSI